MIAEKKTLKKITMATGVVAMAIGLATSFSLDAYAETTTGGHNLHIVLTHCVNSSGTTVGYANDCEPGTQECIDTTCK